jgi:hypothetical protein
MDDDARCRSGPPAADFERHGRWASSGTGDRDGQNTHQGAFGCRGESVNGLAGAGACQALRSPSVPFFGSIHGPHGARGLRAPSTPLRKGGPAWPSWPQRLPSTLSCDWAAMLSDCWRAMRSLSVSRAML